MVDRDPETDVTVKEVGKREEVSMEIVVGTEVENELSVVVTPLGSAVVV